MGMTGGGLLGRTHAGGAWDVFIMKLNAAGEVLWTRLHGTSGRDPMYGHGTIVIDPTNGASTFVFSPSEALPGQTSAGSNDIAVMQISAAGELVWTLQIGSSGTDYARGIVRHPDGTFAVCRNSLRYLSLTVYLWCTCTIVTCVDPIVAGVDYIVACVHVHVFAGDTRRLLLR